MIINIPTIHVEFYFTGDFKDKDKISQALQINENIMYLNNTDADETRKCWGVSVGDVKSTLLIPLLEILMSIIPEYKYCTINELKKEYNLKSCLHVTVKTEEKTPYLCLTNECIDFLNKTETILIEFELE